MQPLAPYLRSMRTQVFVLVLAVIALSTFIKNVGALAILMPWRSDRQANGNVAFASC